MSDNVLTGTDQYDRIVIINPDEIIAVHAEKKWCRIITESADYICRKRLYELENTLGPEFMRTSKSIIVNIRRIGSVEAVFNGMMLLHMKNGSKEYVSRTYLPNLKSFLCWRQRILTIPRQIKSANLSQLIMTKHNRHSLSAVT